VVLFSVGGPADDQAHFAIDERFAVGQMLHQGHCFPRLVVVIAAFAEICGKLRHRHPSVKGTACRLESSISTAAQAVQIE